MNKRSDFEMKTILKSILVFSFIGVLITVLPAQDTTKTVSPQGKQVLQKDSLSNQQQEQNRKKFIDKNMNGIDDREEKGKKKKQDEFIDLDGDGINDGQESGTGLKKAMQYRKRKTGGGKKGN